MSDIVEKTFAALPGLITGGLVGSPDVVPGSRRGFVAFIKNVKDCSTKFEEEQILNRELKLLRQKLSHPNTTQTQIKEYVMQLLFCDMLGCDVSFGYISAIKLAQQGSLLERRVGYLATTMFLHEDHELCVLLVNSLQKDLRSTNVLEVCTALTVICHLTNVETIPMMLPLVEEKLTHPRELVRKKAVMCLHRFYTKASNIVQHLHHKLKKALCDKDPGVMATTLHVYSQLIRDDPSNFKDITPSLVSILRQIIERKLPKSFEYHHVPAPWIQITIMKMLAVLGKDDQKTSQLIYPILTEVLQRSEINQNITFGVVHECILTGASIYPHPKLLEDLAKCVGKFLRAKNNNLRYLGLKSLGALVQIDPVHAVSHQLTIIDCLEDQDVAIRRKTLDILCKMTNPSNVSVICSKLLDHFKRDSDHYLRSELVGKVLMLSEKFCSTLEWYIEMINSVILSAGEFVPHDLGHTVISVISKGTDSVESSRDSKKYAAEIYLKLLQDKGLSTSSVLVQISSWVLGTYWNLLEGSSSETQSCIIRLLIPFMNSDTVCASSKHWVLNALLKLVTVCQDEDTLKNMASLSLTDQNPHMRHRVKEILHLNAGSQDIKEAMTINNDSSLQFDFTLSFLDDYVCDAIEAGATPYKPISLRTQQIQETEAVSELFASLSHKEKVTPSPQPSQQSSLTKSSPSGLSGSSGNKEALNRETALNLKGVKRVWGPEGVSDSHNSGDVVMQGNSDQGSGTSERQTGQNQESRQIQNFSKTSEDDKRKQELAAALFSGIS